MPQTLPISNVGEFGIITDLLDTQLPPNAWSAGNNVRFFENRAAAVLGYQDIITPSVAPYYLDTVTRSGLVYYVYAGLDNVYTYEPNADQHVDRTRDAGATVFTGAATDIWNGGVLHDFCVLTNGVDSPVFWEIGTTNDFANMIYSGANTWADQSQTCKILLPLKYHLLAMNIKVSNDRYQRRVAWPDPAEPGAMPTDWDPTSATNRAGWIDLVGGTGPIRTAKGMAESAIIYCDDIAFRADWVGGNQQFDFNPLEWAKGAITQRAVAVLPGGNHFAVAPGDVYMHNGREYFDVADEKRRRIIFSDVDESNYDLMFVVVNPPYNEVMICIPQANENFCTIAHVFNYKRRSWSKREIPNLTAAVYAEDPASIQDSWKWSDLATTKWSEMTFPWGGEGYNPMNRSLIASSASGSGAIYRMDSSNQADGTNIATFLERTGLNIGGGDAVVTVTGLIPRLNSTGPVDLQVGGQMIPGGPVTWSPAVSFDPSTDQRATFWQGASGRYNAIRISSEANIMWELESMILEYQIRGGA